MNEFKKIINLEKNNIIMEKKLKVLIINTCKHTLHYYEFVRPIEDILRDNNIEFNTIKYPKLTQDLLEHTNKIIICGTSLQDNSYSDQIAIFEPLKKFNGPILGICAGMQIISNLYGAEIVSGNEIGMIDVNFQNFLGLDTNHQVYALHNFRLSNHPLDFVIMAQNKYIQAIKHSKKPIYGVLFHPEARNRIIIETFLYQNS